METKMTYKYEPKKLSAAADLPEVCVDDNLMSIKYFVDEGSAHLAIRSQETCLQCEHKPCLYFCPVRVYTAQADGQIQIGYQACVECGSCRVGCPFANIEWKLPRGGFGVAYKFG